MRRQRGAGSESEKFGRTGARRRGGEVGDGGKITKDTLFINQLANFRNDGKTAELYFFNIIQSHLRIAKPFGPVRQVSV